MRKLTLLLGDISLFYGALYVTLLIRYQAGFADHINDHVYPFTIVFLIWILVLYIANAYDLTFAKNNLIFYRSFSYAMLFNGIIALAFFYLVPYFQITPKTNFFIYFGLIFISLVLWRWISNRLLRLSGVSNNALIIGQSTQSSEMYDFLLNNKQLGYNPLGILDIRDQKAIIILEKLIRKKEVRTLVLDPEAYKIPDIINILYSLLDLRITFYSLSDFYEQVTGKIPLQAIDQGWFIDNLTEAKKRAYDLASSIFDFFAAVLLAIITLPFYPLIIIGIKQTPGPIFYTQRRIGKSGKLLTLIKFRSMVDYAEKTTGAIWSPRNDPRITKFGNFMRKTRVDELPQVWNVLKGEMSFVGPRSERPEFHNKLKEQIPFYEERYLVKPGLTGWAQVKNIFLGDTYSGSVGGSFEKLQYDLYYIKNRSLLLDLGIILKTINIVFQRAGR